MPIVGEVYLLRCGTCLPPKQKLFVVALLTPLRCFLINSQLRAAETRSPQAQTMAVPILAASHPFLTHDSYVSCSDLMGEYTDANDFPAACYVGDLDQATRAMVLASFAQNSQLPTSRLALLTSAWT